MKKRSKIARAAALILTASLMLCATACSSEFTADGAITVISREDGSGTRGAFIELFGIEVKNDDGTKTDQTLKTADVNSDTGVVLTSVAGNKNAIGYISLGALNDTVKALKIDGAAATAENIENGSYSAARPFIIVTKDEISAVAADFIAFILSTEGQAVAAERGYIAVSDTEAYSGGGGEGKITVSGSSSVTPLMEKLREAYLVLNPDVQIEIQQTDSSAGISDAASGISDIGMASRELKESELERGVSPTVICTDGIAVIVNAENTIDELTSEQVRKIYTGEVTKWSEVIN